MMYKAMDANKITTTMTIDMSAAFDCVRHDVLLQKLPMYKFGRKTCLWIQSYLEHRSNFVEIGDRRSRIAPAPTGVPQGSCLGPLLYLIALNELPETAKDPNCENSAHDNVTKLFGDECPECGSLPIFADDGMYVFSSNSRRTNQENINSRFYSIKHFLTANGLSVNDTKTGLTEVMSKQKRGRIHGSPPNLQVRTVEDGEIVENLVEDKNVCRFLGINLENNQSWKAHIITGKKAMLPLMKRKLGSLYHLRDKVPWKSRLLLANSIVMGRLIYSISLWGGAADRYLNRVQSVQNWAARFVTKAPKRTRSIELMVRCKWLNVRELIQYHSLIQLWKIVKWKTPAVLSEELTVEDDWTVAVVPPRLQMSERCYLWRTVPMWNLLPPHLKDAARISIFKKTTKVLDHGKKTWPSS